MFGTPNATASAAPTVFNEARLGPSQRELSPLVRALVDYMSAVNRPGSLCMQYALAH
jgi:hypothetical protein